LGWGGRRLLLPLGFLSSPLDWVSGGVEDEDLSFVIDAIEQDFHQVKNGAHLKIKGRIEVLNLKSSIDYGDANVPSRRRK
jgi:hypothetical protein